MKQTKIYTVRPTARSFEASSLELVPVLNRRGKRRSSLHVQLENIFKPAKANTSYLQQYFIKLRTVCLHKIIHIRNVPSSELLRGVRWIKTGVSGLLSLTFEDMNGR